MKSTCATFALAALLAGGLPVTVAAEDGVKTLPTLLIKGEVVSLDAADPSATLLKVKDRYGFETPIFLTPETKITSGSNAAASSTLTAGLPVEVEYNFDVNTAKRHAVSVKLATPAAEPAPAAAAQAALSIEASAPAEPAPAAAEPAPAQPADIPVQAAPAPADASQSE